ncbi:LOW QUALITY PROTEIN: hypothetical protein ACHAW6_015771 [Cyclotella cf. meneghiniana]
MTYELIPLDMHRRNIVEKAIQTFNDHFVAILSGVNDSFPMHLWDQLLPQEGMTLNLLRQSKVTPTISAHAYLNGPHDNNQHPLVQFGCAVQMHGKPGRMKSWDPHSISGWYMYGLPQAGLLAYELLEKQLNKHGYHQLKFTLGLWTHESRPICFTLVVDDFGMKFQGREHALHLVNIFKEYYEISENWMGRKYIGLTFDWDYEKGEVYVSMLGYELRWFGHEQPKRHQDQPHKHIPPIYGAKKQFAASEDKSPLLDKKDKQIIQHVMGVFLF